jgi:hypothetical protein
MSDHPDTSAWFHERPGGYVWLTLPEAIKDQAREMAKADEREQARLGLLAIVGGEPELIRRLGLDRPGMPRSVAHGS